MEHSSTWNRCASGYKERHFRPLSDRVGERRLGFRCRGQRFKSAYDRLDKTQRTKLVATQPANPIAGRRILYGLKLEIEGDIHQCQPLRAREAEIRTCGALKRACHLFQGDCVALHAKSGRDQPSHEIPTKAGSAKVKGDQVAGSDRVRIIDSEHRSGPVSGEIAKVMLPCKQGQRGLQSLYIVVGGQFVTIPPFTGSTRIKIRHDLRDRPRPHSGELCIQRSNRGDRTQRCIECDHVPEGAHSSVRPACNLEPGRLHVRKDPCAPKGAKNLALRGRKAWLLRRAVESLYLKGNLQRETRHRLVFDVRYRNRSLSTWNHVRGEAQIPRVQFARSLRVVNRSEYRRES